MRGVLFDLDGTLLDIDLQSFLDRYFEALTEWSLPVLPAGTPPQSFRAAVSACTRAMMAPHLGRTNREVFNDEMQRLIGISMDDVWPVYERFYAEVFPSLRDSAAPRAGARRAVTTALDLGLSVVIATNPIFPKSAVEARLAWAGLDDLPFAGVTSYEHATACKPHATYFREAAALAGLEPHECLMVGDDRFLDMPASDVGMKTFYVGDTEGNLWADASGSLDDLVALLPALVRSSGG
ncbi:MAG: HAD family hydrolase [Anaerosomatales bacterium]|nr:HAD family hydrolase [Coriobacteriia bacterium]MDI6692804.1 HAD family hydrolase [Anaerosomatales bacterium]GAV31090.1 predicted hydrolase [Coriobacteriaceae bacterium EMTCatB1]